MSGKCKNMTSAWHDDKTPKSLKQLVNEIKLVTNRHRKYFLIVSTYFLWTLLVHNPSILSSRFLSNRSLLTDMHLVGSSAIDSRHLLITTSVVFLSSTHHSGAPVLAFHLRWSARLLGTTWVAWFDTQRTRYIKQKIWQSWKYFIIINMCIDQVIWCSDLSVNFG